jgi:hypothetical protein
MKNGNELLRQTLFDPEFLPGARNAVRCCLRIEAHEKVTLITDRATIEIGAVWPPKSTNSAARIKPGS